MNKNADTSLKRQYNQLPLFYPVQNPERKKTTELMAKVFEKLDSLFETPKPEHKLPYDFSSWEEVMVPPTPGSIYAELIEKINNLVPPTRKSPHVDVPIKKPQSQPKQEKKPQLIEVAVSHKPLLEVKVKVKVKEKEEEEVEEEEEEELSDKAKDIEENSFQELKNSEKIIETPAKDEPQKDDKEFSLLQDKKVSKLDKWGEKVSMKFLKTYFF